MSFIFSILGGGQYLEAEKKSKYVFQYKCKSCRNKWWGSRANNQCRKCKTTVERLSLEETVGVGWFKCECGRTYAGLTKGNVTSKCHACQKENYPNFIVPGDKAEGEERKNTHYCSMCKGSYNCPIVAQVRKSKFH